MKTKIITPSLQRHHEAEQIFRLKKYAIGRYAKDQPSVSCIDHDTPGSSCCSQPIIDRVRQSRFDRVVQEAKNAKPDYAYQSKTSLNHKLRNFLLWMRYMMLVYPPRQYFLRYNQSRLRHEHKTS